MVKRTRDEAAETRNGILDAAERVFSVRGVSHTSLEDIAKAAGVTRGAIYWHFRNKSELFTAMVDRVTFPLGDPGTGGTGDDGARAIHVQWRDLAGNWSPPLVIEAWVTDPAGAPTPDDL